MKRKRIWGIVLAAVMVGQAFTLTGCSGGGNSKNDTANSGEVKSGEEKSETAQPGETVELRFHDIIPNPAREAKFKELVERFNQENPNIKVVYESTPWDQAHNKLVTQSSADVLPDVTIMHASWAGEFNSAGWVIPLDSYIDSWGCICWER